MFVILSFLWAAGIVIHQTHFCRIDALPYVVLNAAAVLTLLRPGSIPRFAFLLAAQLICFAWQLPIVVNHWMMLAFAALTVLAALLGGRPRSTDEWYARIAPFVQAQIVVVYFFATFHKINVSYFDPSLSCAADHLLKLAAKVAVVPTGDWAKYVSMYGVLLIEGGLPILLLIRRTRYATIVGGTIFHLALGVNGYHDFSAVALVFYAVFLPSDFPARLVAFAKRHPRIGAACRRVAGFSRAPIVSVAAVAVVIGLAVLSPALGWSHRDKYVMLHVPFHAIWFVVTIAAIGVLIACRRPVASATATPAPQRLSTPVRMAGTFIVFVVFLNGASPYLGLKTEHSFAMFSNLQTEGDEWNHLIVPPAIQVFDLQDDLVEIVESSDAHLTDLGQRRLKKVWLEFRRYLLYRPDTSVTYRRGGVEYRVQRCGDDPKLSEPLPLLVRKLFWFRSVSPADENHCKH